MVYYIAVDTSLTMGFSCGGKIAKNHEKTRFRVAVDIVAALVQRAFHTNAESAVSLFRIGEKFNEVKSMVTVGDDIVGLMTKKQKDGTPVPLFGRSNMGSFMAHMNTKYTPTPRDKIIILTDCSTFEGDTNYLTSCETRFVIVNTNKDTMSETQMEELDEIAAQSIGHEPTPDNEALFHHFFVNDFASLEDLTSAIVEELFDLSIYHLRLGNLSTLMKISHTFSVPAVTSVQLIGFCKGTNLQNLEAVSTHFVHPVYFPEDIEEDARGDFGDSDDEMSERGDSVPRTLDSKTPSPATDFDMESETEEWKKESSEEEMEEEEEEEPHPKKRIRGGKRGKGKKEKKEEDSGTNSPVEVNAEEEWLAELTRRAFVGGVESDHDRATAPFLVQILCHTLKAQDLIALGLLNSGGYVALCPGENSQGTPFLLISLLPAADEAPKWMPDLTKLRCALDDKMNGVDLHVKDPTNTGVSYVYNRTSWFTESAVDSETTKIKKNLRRLPEKTNQFYLDVNKLRQYAYATCNPGILLVIGEFILEEAQSVSPIAIQHATHVLKYFKTISETSRFEEIPTLKITNP